MGVLVLNTVPKTVPLVETEGVTDALTEREFDTDIAMDVVQEIVAVAVPDADRVDTALEEELMDGLWETDAVIVPVALAEGVGEIVNDGLGDMVTDAEIVLLAVTDGVIDVDGVGGMYTSGSDSENCKLELEMDCVNCSITSGTVPPVRVLARAMSPSTAKST